MLRKPKRVRCEECLRLCLPEHAPVHTVNTPEIDDLGFPVKVFARLCRVPVLMHRDGGYAFAGCGPNHSATYLHARLLDDPYLYRKALQPIIIDAQEQDS